MRRLIIPIASLLISACAATPPSALTAREERGRQIAEQNCSVCHAIGAQGESPAPEAPPFRTLSANYRVSNLEEALAEGISVGHPAMPQFQFEPDDVDALISYLQTIQETS